MLHLTVRDAQDLREVCRIAASYHNDETACRDWLTCKCRLAEVIRRANTLINKLELLASAE